LTVLGINGGWVKERDSIYAFSGENKPRRGTSLEQRAGRRQQLAGQGDAGITEPGAASQAAGKPGEGDGGQGMLLSGGRHGGIRGSFIFLSP